MNKFFLSKYFSLVMFSLGIAACGGGSVSANPVSVPPPTSIYPLPELKILVIGQSIASNCNEYIYGPVNNVFQVGKNGVTKAAADPFEWSDCSAGSMWMPLGKNIVEAGIAKKVTFMPIGVGATRVEDWQAGGSAFGKLNTAISLIQSKNISFDFAFWHQGSSNKGTNQTVYYNNLNSVFSYVNDKVKIKRWLIAVHSRCYGAYDNNIEAAQLSFGNAPDMNRYPGANNNLLGDDYRFDGCHLNKKGQEKMASMWLESIKNALK